MVQDVTQRKHAEAVLRHSEQLNRAILASLREHVAVLDRRGKIIQVNEAWSAFARAGGVGSRDCDERVGVGANYLDVCRQASTAGDPDAGRAVRGIEQVLAGAAPWFEMEYVCPTPAHELVFLMTVTPLGRASGDADNAGVSAGGAVVLHRDVTELKRAEHAIRQSEASLRASNHRSRDLAGRLITAQEAERSRIARELHDDVNQQVAAIAIALSALKRRLPEGCGLDGDLADVQRRAVEVAEDIRSLSHEFHPGVLRHAGLVAALQAHCGEFRARHHLPVSFRADADVEPLSADVSLCLYRVSQEALANVVRHAEARHADVSLSLAEAGSAVELTVSDDGRGFDPAREDGADGTDGGLGLISLDERVRLAGGELEISSAPGRGTTLRVRVPYGNGDQDHATSEGVACG
jgi:signal transduction histidine kinase